MFSLQAGRVAGLPELNEESGASGELMKKVSLFGLILGGLLGVFAGLMSGSWFFWLAMGLVIGVIFGSAQARRRFQRPTNIAQESSFVRSMQSK